MKSYQQSYQPLYCQDCLFSTISKNLWPHIITTISVYFSSYMCSESTYIPFFVSWKSGTWDVFQTKWLLGFRPTDLSLTFCTRFLHICPFSPYFKNFKLASHTISNYTCVISSITRKCHYLWEWTCFEVNFCVAVGCSNPMITHLYTTHTSPLLVSDQYYQPETSHLYIQMY